MNYVFLEKFGTLCYNLYSSTKNNTAEEALHEAKSYGRGGQIIQIEGNFMYSLDKIVGIQINCGGNLFKNAEGCYDYDDVQELIKTAEPCAEDKLDFALSTLPLFIEWATIWHGNHKVEECAVAHELSQDHSHVYFPNRLLEAVKETDAGWFDSWRLFFNEKRSKHETAKTHA